MTGYGTQPSNSISSPSAVAAVSEEIAEDACISDYRVYWSLRELKKSSMNYVRGDSGEER